MELYDKQSNLRDIKREQTANKLADAAFKLALERGMDGFVVKDIVQQAGYSRRTFANHFSCKEEAVVAVALNLHGACKVEDFLSENNENMLLIDILYHMMRMQFTADLLKKLRQLVSLSRRYPSLEPYILSVFQHFQMETVKTVSNLSSGHDTEEYPHLLAGAVYGAVLPLLDGSLTIQFSDESTGESHRAMTFEQYLDTAFNYLRNGF